MLVIVLTVRDSFINMATFFDVVIFNDYVITWSYSENDKSRFFFPYCDIWVKVVTYDRFLQSLNPLKTIPFFTINCKLSFRSASIQSTTNWQNQVPTLHFFFCFTMMYCTAGKIGIGHVTIFLSKYISKGEKYWKSCWKVLNTWKKGRCKKA